MFCKKGVLRKFAKFTGKHPYRSLFFNKVVGHRPATLLKKGLCYRYFPVNIAKFLRASFLTEHHRGCFWSSHSQIFLKIGVLKNFAILEPLSNKVAGLLSQNTEGGNFSILAETNTFFQVNLVSIAESRNGFCSGLLWKHELNLRSRHWSCSVKKDVLRKLAKFTENTCFKVSF